MEVTMTGQGEPWVHYEGYKYTFNRKSEDGFVIWRCAKRRVARCHGMLKTKHGQVLGSHDHQCGATGDTDGLLELEVQNARPRKRARGQDLRMKGTGQPPGSSTDTPSACPEEPDDDSSAPVSATEAQDHCPVPTHEAQDHCPVPTHESQDHWPLTPLLFHREERSIHSPNDLESCHDVSYANSNVDKSEHEDSKYMEPEPFERPAGIMADTLDLFGKYVSSILRQLPIPDSYTLQQKFINEAISAKLKYDSQHMTKPSEKGHLPPPSRPVGTNSGSKHRSSSNRVYKPTSTGGRIRQPTDDYSSSPKLLMPVVEPAFPTNIIKEERMDGDFDLAILSNEGSVTRSLINEDCSEVEIDEELLPVVKPEIDSAFEVVYCNGNQGQVKEASSCSSSGRLDAPPGPGNSLPAVVYKEPTFTCSVCSQTFHNSLQCESHYKESHPGHDPPLKSKAQMRHQPSPKRLCLNPPAHATTTVISSPHSSRTSLTSNSQSYYADIP